MRVGIADHLGWAVAVTAAADHAVVDRRRVDLVERGVSPAPIHYESGRLDVHATAALVASVRASAVRACSAALDDLVRTVPAPVISISLRFWPSDFPDDIAVQRRAPYEARADAIMYRLLLAELAHDRGWEVHCYDARHVEAQAADRLGERADAVLRGPRATLGPPWNEGPPGGARRDGDGRRRAGLADRGARGLERGDALERRLLRGSRAEHVARADRARPVLEREPERVLGLRARGRGRASRRRAAAARGR